MSKTSYLLLEKKIEHIQNIVIGIPDISNRTSYQPKKVQHIKIFLCRTHQKKYQRPDSNQKIQEVKISISIFLFCDINHIKPFTEEGFIRLKKIRMKLK